jgi:hypothetical protein
MENGKEFKKRLIRVLRMMADNEGGKPVMRISPIPGCAMGEGVA